MRDDLDIVIAPEIKRYMALSAATESRNSVTKIKLNTPHSAYHVARPSVRLTFPVIFIHKHRGGAGAAVTFGALELGINTSLPFVSLRSSSVDAAKGLLVLRRHLRQVIAIEVIHHRRHLSRRGGGGWGGHTPDTFDTFGSTDWKLKFLLWKLHLYRVTGLSLGLLEPHLSGRIPSVDVNGERSSGSAVNMGVTSIIQSAYSVLDYRAFVVFSESVHRSRYFRRPCIAAFTGRRRRPRRRPRHPSRGDSTN
ncbi:hypothetical protein EVAR_38514_1 [Eumeta japonica]|uniref:Uncharacterized protein n=1 Tax=Eumeta variegata TaxID=151549 RepID=A0A4C1WDK5_EUMVA|nr:hypothetical protein EVAR_38514_1 [Eumeta japonica]